MVEQKKKRRYITGLDGLRALAVIGVIFYHLIPGKMRGGYLGVPVFFVISGYLITDLLRQEWQENGKIQLKAFYIRRMKRLYPALATLLIGSAAYITLFQRNLLDNLRAVVLSSLTYVNNWWQINNGMSYFDRFNNQSPFTHLWSLAVEAQNYLIWPIIFILLMKFIPKKQNIVKFLFVGTLISALLMGILYQPGSDPTRVYYGTDTRLFSLWLGSLLAFLWPTTHLNAKIPLQAKRVLNISGGVALFILIISFFFLDARYSFVYYGGLYLISVMAMIVVATIAHPGASWNRWLTNPVLTYLGKRSYSIYLYQFPVMIFYEAKVKNIAENVWLHTVIELVLILVLSELSYRFIEKNNVQWTYTAFKQFLIRLKAPSDNVKKIQYIMTSAIILIGLFGIFTAPVNVMTQEQRDFQASIEKNKNAAKDSLDNPKIPDKPITDEDGTNQSTESTEEVQAIMARYQLTQEQVLQGEQLEITAFGDSVMLGATLNLQEVFPHIIVDAKVGRQLYNSVEDLKKLKEQGLLKSTVLLGLGSNGAATETQFDQLMAVLGDRQVYLVNVCVPTQRWQNEVNRLLKDMANKYENVTLIDWYDTSQGQGSWFREDSVHPNELGLEAYTTLIAQSILTQKNK
ncbi:MAG TPA: acetyltransferase [Candidatus Enterococcus avicola]|uniref:Acetyltransferase n=1 Tax=Candidatus Enterococcus avicola TaxID=2838561 RepID=A0A9D2F7L2_9ENTE|nr:acetyltransferase [Candidatus Enterococcus avicola]